jgi:ATP-dependent DNA helicase RecG
MYPAEAVREALVNAFAHRDYSSPSGGITVGVFPDRLEIWNSGGLPEGVTVEKLAQGQLSVLRNPDIAHVLYLRGLMERLGRGSVLILNACQKHGLPKPVWTSDERSGVTLTFFTPQVTPQVTPQDTPQVTPQVERLLAVVRGTMSREELMAGMGVSDRKHFMAAYLGPALELGLVEMTLPGKPTSGNQRYRLTPLGQQLKRS